MPKLKAEGSVTHVIKVEQATMLKGGLIFLAVNVVIIIVSALVKMKLK